MRAGSCGGLSRPRRNGETLWRLPEAPTRARPDRVARQHGKSTRGGADADGEHPVRELPRALVVGDEPAPPPGPISFRPDRGQVRSREPRPSRSRNRAPGPPGRRAVPARVKHLVTVESLAPDRPVPATALALHRRCVLPLIEVACSRRCVAVLLLLPSLHRFAPRRRHDPQQPPTPAPST